MTKKETNQQRLAKLSPDDCAYVMHTIVNSKSFLMSMEQQVDEIRYWLEQECNEEHFAGMLKVYHTFYKEAWMNEREEKI